MQKVFSIYDKALRVLLCCTTGGFVVICLVQIFYRYVLRNSIVWSNEACNLLFYISIFLGSAICVTEKRHITIDIVLMYLPRKILRYWYLGIYAVMLLFSLYMVVNGYQLALGAAMQRTSTLHMSYYQVYLSIPITCALMAVNVVRVAVLDFTVTYAPERGPKPDMGGEAG